MNEDTQDFREGLSRILSKAERMLQAAEAAMDDGFVESAASRAYYSAFHAIQALPRSIDKTYSKHSGVIAAFRRDFIKTGVFPPEFGMALTRLSKHRDIGDYSYIWTLKPEQVKDDIQKAGKILKAITSVSGIGSREGMIIWSISSTSGVYLYHLHSHHRRSWQYLGFCSGSSSTGYPA
jgi:uncharacterized protein (UPF0332 family)